MRELNLRDMIFNNLIVTASTQGISTVDRETALNRR
jgi:hypothetical protein